MTFIKVVRGSLLDQDVDYIVNAANTMMRGGGGIDGAIHQAAGPKLLLELHRVAPQGCETGAVIVTDGHNLKHKGILHTPGPRWKGGNSGESMLLASSYRNCLIAAHERNATSIAFCSISTGVYGYPIDQAALIALTTVKEWLEANSDTTIGKVIFAMRGQKEFEVFTRTLQELTGS